MIALEQEKFHTLLAYLDRGKAAFPQIPISVDTVGHRRLKTIAMASSIEDTTLLLQDRHSPPIIRNNRPDRSFKPQSMNLIPVGINLNLPEA